jgi:HSP90 family molecular chaperone
MIKAKGSKKLDSDEQSNLIGQFGVGFYSGFLVADKMTVYSKGLNDPEGKTHMWQSEAGSSYTITEVDGDDAIEAGSGTRSLGLSVPAPIVPVLPCTV